MISECTMCCSVKEVRLIDVYSALNPKLIDDTINICEDCESNELTACDKCGNYILSTDINYSDYRGMIPYDDNLGDERYKIISTFESKFYCNDCFKSLFKGMNWKEILKKISN